MKSRSLVYIVRGGLIAALYLALTMIFAPISFGSIQLRVAEALTVLPMFFPESVFALAFGCLVSNMVSSFGVADMILGSFATLTAAVITSKIKNKYLAPIPSVIINALVVGGMIAYMSSSDKTVFFTVFATNFLTVGAGQAIVCYSLGIPLATAVERILPRSKNNITRK